MITLRADHDLLHSVDIRINALFFLVILLASLPVGTRAQVVLTGEFIQELRDNNLSFKETILDNYVNAPISDNPHMNYEFAVRSKNIPMEVRYSIRRYEPPQKSSVPPENMHPAMFEVTLLNIGRETARDSPLSNVQIFEPDEVMKEFNADWGAAGTVVPKKEFANNFDRCTVIFISKQRVEAFIFYLFNFRDQKAVLKEMKAIFHVIRFR
jgi:hypothetical protein